MPILETKRKTTKGVEGPQKWSFLTGWKKQEKKESLSHGFKNGVH